MNLNSKRNLMLGAAIVLVLNFSSCKKYEDGPMFSLKTKKARLTGEWEIVEIDGNKADEDVIIEFEKDGDFKMSYSYSYYGYSYTYSSKGDWEWESGKESLEISIDGYEMEWDILRLTNSELWIEDEAGEEMQLEKI